MLILAVVDLHIDVLSKNQVAGIIQLHIEIVIAAGTVVGTASIIIVVVVVLGRLLCVQTAHRAAPGLVVVDSGMNNDRKTCLHCAPVLFIGSGLYPVVSGRKNRHEGIAVIIAAVSI